MNNSKGPVATGTSEVLCLFVLHFGKSYLLYRVKDRLSMRIGEKAKRLSLKSNSISLVFDMLMVTTDKTTQGH